MLDNLNNELALIAELVSVLQAFVDADLCSQTNPATSLWEAQEIERRAREVLARARKYLPPADRLTVFIKPYRQNGGAICGFQCSCDPDGFPRNVCIQISMVRQDGIVVVKHLFNPVHGVARWYGPAEDVFPADCQFKTDTPGVALVINERGGDAVGGP